MTQLNPVYTDTAVATAKPTVPLAETPEQKSSLATLEVHVDDSLAHASELETKLQQYASTADPSEQTKAELAEIDQRLATVQSDLWTASGFVDQAAHTSGAAVIEPTIESLDVAHQLADTANLNLIETQHQFDTLVASSSQQAPASVVSKVDAALNAVNEEIGWAEKMIEDWNMNHTTGLDNYGGLRKDETVENLGALHQDFKDLLSLKKKLMPENFSTLNGSEQSRLIEAAESQVRESFGQIRDTRNSIHDRTQTLEPFYSVAAPVAKTIRDLSVSGAQSVGQALGGPAGGALAGLAMTALTRAATDQSVNLVSDLNNLTAEEKQQLKSEVQQVMGPAWADYVSGGLSPIIDSKLPSDAAIGGDFTTAFVTTFMIESHNGASLSESFDSALSAGLRAHTLGKAAGAGQNSVPIRNF